jgi:hypothetical protein
VYLTDGASDEPVAWADTIVAVSGHPDATDDLAPDGNPVALVADNSCTEAAFEDVAYPMGGDDGYMLVRFLESDSGNVVNTPPASWNIVVVEWGANCGATPDDPLDTFGLYACAASTHDTTQPDIDCGELLGESESGGVLKVGPQ